MNQRTRIVTVTGTKGKTTCVRALHHAIDAVHTEPVLGVDTDRVVLGDEEFMSKDAYMELFGLGTAVCPGKALLALKDQNDPVAVLEASVGVWRRGLGYLAHEIGIFTNVYDDHIKPNGLITSREMLAEKKASYIFGHIAKNGTAIYNADNDLVPTQLNVIPSDQMITRVACTLNPALATDADYMVTIENERIVIRQSGIDVFSTEYLHMPWLYGGKHQPSLYNALFVVSALWRFFKDDVSKLDIALRALADYTPDAHGSRMVVKTAGNGATVILDFAHEAESLKQIALFARELTKDSGRVIGVVRLNNARNDGHIRRTADYFVDSYDHLIIYDKAEEDGEYSRKLGDVPAIIDDVANSHSISSEIIMDDEDALAAAYRMSNANDVIVYIIRDHHLSYDVASAILELKKENV